MRPYDRNASADQHPTRTHEHGVKKTAHGVHFGDCVVPKSVEKYVRNGPKPKICFGFEFALEFTLPGARAAGTPRVQTRCAVAPSPTQSPCRCPSGDADTRAGGCAGKRVGGCRWAGGISGAAFGQREQYWGLGTCTEPAQPRRRARDGDMHRGGHTWQFARWRHGAQHTSHHITITSHTARIHGGPDGHTLAPTHPTAHTDTATPADVHPHTRTPTQPRTRAPAHTRVRQSPPGFLYSSGHRRTQPTHHPPHPPHPPTRSPAPTAPSHTILRTHHTLPHTPCGSPVSRQHLVAHGALGGEGCRMQRNQCPRSSPRWRICVRRTGPKAPGRLRSRSTDRRLTPRSPTCSTKHACMGAAVNSAC